MTHRRPLSRQPLAPLLDAVAAELEQIADLLLAVEAEVVTTCSAAPGSTSATAETLQHIDLILQTVRNLGGFLATLGRGLDPAAEVETGAASAGITLERLRLRLADTAQAPPDVTAQRHIEMF